MHINFDPFFIGGLFTAVAAIAGYWWTYRKYKKIGRRCHKCGSLGVKRISKIELASDESISFRSPAGKLRWWIRRVLTMTFASCPDCKWRELVKLTKGPISVWHAWWTWKTDREQFVADPDLLHIFDDNIRNLRSPAKSLKKHAELDTPPLPSLTEF